MQNMLTDGWIWCGLVAIADDKLGAVEMQEMAVTTTWYLCLKCHDT